jgi:hypothetical protein
MKPMAMGIDAVARDTDATGFRTNKAKRTPITATAIAI